MNERKPIPVTDDVLDAPDGAIINMDDRGWYERRGDKWYPVTELEAADLFNKMFYDERRDMRFVKYTTWMLKKGQE